MSALREAAQQALEALEFDGFTPEDATHCHYTTRAITALRAALAQQEQEPVLVVEQEPDYMSRGHFYEGSKPFIDPTEVWKLPIGTKLYTHPPRRETEQEPAYSYAKQLSEAIWKKHYKDTVPHWKPDNDLFILLTQIDNMTAGMVPPRREWQSLSEDEYRKGFIDGQAEKAPHTIIKLPPLPEPNWNERVYGGHGNEITHRWFTDHQMREYARQAVCESEDAWQSRATHPPRREWQGLTEEEREQATGWSVEHIEAALKEKNA